MTPEQSDFRIGVIKPMECIKEGWALIKDQYWLFFGISLVGILIGGAVPIVLMGPMMVGIFLCLFQRQRNEPVEFGTLFKGFDYFVPGLIVALIKMIPIVVLMVPFYIIIIVMRLSMVMGGRSEPENPGAFIVGMFAFEMLFFMVVMVVSLLIEIFFMFAFPLVADRKLSGMDAVKLSYRAGKANFGGVLGLLLLNALFGFIGILCCIIGVYFYFPV
jgi:uncharacterized membrane protein